MPQKTIICKMNPTEMQANALSKTVTAFTNACNDILQIAIDNQLTNKNKIQAICYHKIKQTHNLSANLVVRAVARTAYALRSAISKGKMVQSFKPSSIEYDERIFEYRERDEQVSISTVEGRMRIPLILGQYQREALKGQKPTCAIVKKKKHQWYIHIVISEEPIRTVYSDNVIGVDRGLYNIAVLSTGKFHSGRKAMDKRKRFASLRQRLQKKGTKSAKRRLKQLSGREHRWMSDVNHCISKSIVKTAKINNATIALEDLQGIRERIKNYGKSLNRKLHSWAFWQLENFIKYKAEKEGIKVKNVPAMNTSRECNRCGFISKDSRSGAHFKCVVCGYRLHADLSAAKAIVRRYICLTTATVNSPNVSTGNGQGQAVGL